MHVIKINILFLAKERLERQIFSVVPSVLYFLFVQPAHKLREGQKGLRTESARAVTGRWCPHSGMGEDFLACRPFFSAKKTIFGQTIKRPFPCNSGWDQVCCHGGLFFDQPFFAIFQVGISIK